MGIMNTVKNAQEKVRTTFYEKANKNLDKMQDLFDLIERLREMFEKALGINSKYSAIATQLKELQGSIEDGVATGEITNDKLDYLIDNVKKLNSLGDKLTPESIDEYVKEVDVLKEALQKDLTKKVVMVSPELSKDFSRNFLNKWEEAFKNYDTAKNILDNTENDLYKEFETYITKNNIQTEEDLLNAFERDAKIYKDKDGNFFIDVKGMVLQAEMQVDENRSIDVSIYVPKTEKRTDLKEIKPAQNSPIDKIQLFLSNACKEKGYDYFINEETLKKTIDNKLSSAMKTTINKVKSYGLENYDFQKLLATANTKEGYTSDDGKISAIFDSTKNIFKFRDNTSGEMLGFKISDGNLKIEKIVSSNKDFSISSGTPIEIGNWERDPSDNSLIGAYNFSKMGISTMNLLKSPEVTAYLKTLGISAENQREVLTREFDEKKYWSKIDPSKMKNVQKMESSIKNAIKSNSEFKGYKTQLKTFSSDDGKREYTFLNVFAKNGDRMSFAFDTEGKPVSLNYFNKENNKKYHSLCDIKTMCISHEITELASDKDFCNMYNICRQVLDNDMLPEFEYKPIEKVDEKKVKSNNDYAKPAYPVDEKRIFDDNRSTAYIAESDRKYRAEPTQTDKNRATDFNEIALYAINLPANLTVRDMETKICEHIGTDNEHIQKNIIGALHDIGVIPTETNSTDRPKRMSEKEYIQVLTELAANPEMRENFDKYTPAPIKTLTEAVAEVNKEKENFTAVLLDSYAVSPDRKYSVYTNSVLPDYTRQPEITNVIAGVVEHCLETDKQITASNIQTCLDVEYDTASKIMDTMVQCGIGTEENFAINLNYINKDDIIKQIGLNDEKTHYQQTMELAKDYAPTLESHLLVKEEVTIPEIKIVAHVTPLTAKIIADNLVEEGALDAPERETSGYKVNKEKVMEERLKTMTNVDFENNDFDNKNSNGDKSTKKSQPIGRD